MKKLIAVSFALILSIAVLTLQTSAVDYEDENVNISVISETTESFLSQATRNMYLYEDNEFDALSIEALPVSYSENHTFAAGNGKSILLSSCRSTMDLVDSKIEYYKYLRSTQGFEVQDFTQTYTFKDITVYGDTAMVTVNELLTWQYADYYLPSGASINYEVTLVKEGGQWWVAEVIAPGELFDGKYIMGSEAFDLSNEIAKIDTCLEREAAAIQAAAEKYPVPAKAQTRASSYSVSKAVAYARTWAMGRNSAFIDFDNRDCMNFASQCIYAGLGGSASSPNTAYMDKSGSNVWYWNDYGAWCNCAKFRTYINSSDSILNTEVLELNPTYDIPFWYSGNIEGSIALVESSEGVKWGHAIFLVDSLSPARKDIYFCAHSTNRINEKLSAFYYDDDIYFIGIS